ncbi:hypothetical protein ACVRYP_03600 [Streptococcus rifensis]
MLNKVVYKTAILASVSLTLVACQTEGSTPEENTKQTTEVKKSYQGISEFAKAVEEANKKVDSVHVDTRVEFYDQKDSLSQAIETKADVTYQMNEWSRIKGVIEAFDDDQKQMHYEIISLDGKLYVKETENGDFAESTFDNAGIRPEYFTLLDHFYENAEDLKFEEKSDEYLVTLKNKDLSLISTFGKEYGFSLSGSLTEEDAEKELMLLFDKETLFMKEIRVGLAIEKNDLYGAIIGYSEFSQWNDIKEDDIQAPI